MVPDNLQCLFSAEITESDGEYVIKIPRSELDTGNLAAGERYRVGLYPSVSEPVTAEIAQSESKQQGQQPPVGQGDKMKVEIEDTGDQGDGIARIDSGYVIFVPNTDVGDRVTIEITEARETVGFGEVLEKHNSPMTPTQ
jgi:predicted RNA-binding protein with TRAM domain